MQQQNFSSKNKKIRYCTLVLTLNIEECNLFVSRIFYFTLVFGISLQRVV